MALKQDLITTAYTHLTIFGISLGPSNEDTSFALDVLEDMAAELEARNICTGYNFQDEPDVNDESGLPRAFLNAFKTNLAIRLIAAFGKAVPPTLASQANQSLSSLSARTAKIRVTPYPSRQPRGSANTLRFNRWRRYYIPENQASQSCATNSMQIDEVNDYVEHYDAYLIENEDIDTFIIESTSGLNVISSSNTFTDINYRVEALSTSETGQAFQIIKLTVTTTDGRVDIREVSFNVTG